MTDPTSSPFKNPPLTREPVKLICPNCQDTVFSNITHRDGLCTWLSCFTCFIFGGCLGCCLIPFCIKGCQDVHHSCPSCYAHIGDAKIIGK